jgi:hypothetical protein
MMTLKYRRDDWEAESSTKPPLRNDQQWLLASVVPMQVVPLAVLNLAFIRAESLPFICTQPGKIL